MIKDDGLLTAFLIKADTLMINADKTCQFAICNLQFAIKVPSFV